MEQLDLAIRDKAAGARLFEEVYAMHRLKRAYQKVKANKGKPGVDEISIEDFEENLNENLAEIQSQLKGRKYKPQPVLRVSIPKPNGGERHLGIPTVRDRIVQYSITMALEPWFEPNFSESSYGFRPNRSQKGAIAEAKKHVANGKEWVVDLDLEKFFDTVNHDRVLHLIRKEVTDRRLLKLIALFLRSGVEVDGKLEKSVLGLPQGSPLSPLLSNIVLHPLDLELEKRGLDFVRYADDANIFVGSQKAAERILESVTQFIEGKLKLKVNQEKTQAIRSKYVKFLGMTILVGGIAMISMSSMKRARARIKELIPRSGKMSFEHQLERVNRWYIGWSGYYSMTHYPSQLKQIEAHTRMRFRLQFLKNHKRKKHFMRAVCRRGVKRETAYRAIYQKNAGRWKLGHDFVVNKAWAPYWFEQQGHEIRSLAKQEHWQDISVYPRIT